MKIPGYSRYDIDRQGNIVDTATGRCVTRNENSKYAWVYIVPDNCTTKKQVNLHVLVALAFHGPRPAKGIVRFKDGNTHNVDADNLAWVDRSQLGHEVATKRSSSRNPACTPEFTGLVYAAMQDFNEPVTMLTLSEIMQVPYSKVRYAMYGLMSSGKVVPVKGGYAIL